MMARDYPPDMIMLDINLPGFSGLDVFRILREDPATAHILIMALSSNAFPPLCPVHCPQYQSPSVKRA
jgi:CheY-like chemotaxis protein